MLPLTNKFYAPALRWKMGEMEALGSLDEASRERLLPYIIFPPLKARDLEKGRPLSSGEVVMLQIGRLQRYWGSRPCLIDFRFLRFDDDRGLDAAYVSEFLAKGWQFGCKIIPVVDGSTDEYRFGAIAPHIRRTKSGGAIRLSLSDLQDEGLQASLDGMLTSAGISPPESILILDLGDATISNIKDFANFVAEWLSKLHHFGLWARIVVEASNYPQKNPASPNAQATPERREWLSWHQLVENDRGMLDWAMFGDFGADHGQMDFGSGGRPLTHLRYTTSDSWLVCRGGKPETDNDGTIHNVASRILGSGSFMGETYSAGDEFIALCAERKAFGNASTWRWANMVHHLTLATVGAADLSGSPFEAKRTARAKQLSLLLRE